MNKYLKTWLVPSLLFVAVLAAEMLCRRYTYLQKEYYGLFLNTPDYWRELWSGPRPLLTLCGEFLSQFYRYAWAGPALMALGVTLVFLLVRIPLRKFQIPFAILLFAAVLTFSLLPEQREQERWAKVEYASLNRQWDKVIATATPEAAEEDRALIPYALLAHSERGTLPEHLFRYPVTRPEDFDLDGARGRHTYFISALQAQSVGCTNDAIHNMFQLACTTPHGTSFGILRQLIKLNFEAGDKTLARKYTAILAKSPANKGDARAVLRHIDRTADSTPLDTGPSDTAAIFSHNTIQNMRMMADEGYFTPAALDRYRCLLLLRRDLMNLAASFPAGTDYAALPACYQQALCLISDPDIHRRLSPAVTGAFRQYMDAYNQGRLKKEKLIMPGSFWDYFFLYGI